MSNTNTQNTITKDIIIAAPRARVWKALTDHSEFSAWFRISLDGPFTEGATVNGTVKNGDKILPIVMNIRAVTPPSRFVYAWHPYPIDANVDYSKEEPTIVTFTLDEVPGGTRVTVTEEGFDKVPAHRRDEAFRMNTMGWSIQAERLAAYVTAS